MSVAEAPRRAGKIIETMRTDRRISTAAALRTLAPTRAALPENESGVRELKAPVTESAEIALSLSALTKLTLP